MHSVEPHPIRLVVEDDLRRNRLTVFFRLLLAIPHFVWIALWTIAEFFVAILSWFIVLITGRLPNGLHTFSSAYVRYATHLYAYLYLAANGYPGFTGEAGSYPVDVQIASPERQSRWKTAFRIVLVVPAFIIVSALIGGPEGGGGSSSDRGGESAGYYIGGPGLAFAAAFLGWFVCLVRARMPLGFRDLIAYALRYGAQTYGYFLFLTDRYPDSDPADPSPARPPYRPVALTSEVDDLRRSRLTVFFRLLLFLPHLVWLVLWGIAVVVALIAAWFATLVTGRLPLALHRFLGAYLRYQTHAFAFVTLVGNQFPGFGGAPGSYPIDVRIDSPEPQNRWKTLFRIFLVIPALIVNSAFGGALWIVAFLGWFAALFTARMPRGLRGVGAYALGYSAQMNGYLYLLTERYPYTGPPGMDGEPEPEAARGWPEGSPSPSS
jgi:Domain of unknown function (DUF4389)